MKVLQGKFMFKVAFGKPSGAGGGYYFTSGGIENEYFVIAETYDAAIQKAIEYRTENHKAMVLDSIGSINMPDIHDFTVNKVEVVTDKILA